MSHATINEACHTYELVTSHIWIEHATLMNESRYFLSHDTTSRAFLYSAGGR